MSHFGSHFVFAYILNCSTLTMFQFSVWSTAMPKETESIRKNLIPQNKVRPQIWVWLPDYSYVSQLLDSRLRSFVAAGHIAVRYVFRRGGTYDKFLTEPRLFERIHNEDKPDYLLVILAGNPISNDTTNEEKYTSARSFYARVRESFPDSKIIATQAEKRFYKNCSKWNCSTETEYTKRRNQFNGFLARSMFKNHTLMMLELRSLTTETTTDATGCI